MYLGIEIGGTKLQLGVGSGDGPPLVALEQRKVEPHLGAEGIRAQIESIARPLLQKHAVQAIGIGFGGPVDPARGRTVKSHQIAGWDDFPLVAWCEELLDRPVAVGNDADVAGLAEAHYGAGRGEPIVFYITVGSGIGGAQIHHGRLYTGGHGIASEIGHLRPGLLSDRPDQTLESLASGWGITSAAQARLSGEVAHAIRRGGERGLPDDAGSMRRRLVELDENDQRDRADLLARCGDQIDALTTVMLAEAARAGNLLARDVFARSYQALGWAIGQVITLIAPTVVVIGGGVSLMGEEQFFAPLREEVDRYVFPPLRRQFRIVPAALGEQVVVHGAIALASQRVSG